MEKQLFTTIDRKKALFSELYAWEAPERYWRPKDRSWFVSYFAFFISIIALAALLSQFILIIAVVAFMFLWFVQGSTPPQVASFSINSLGIRAYGKLYKWKDIKLFWFSENKDVKFLNLDTQRSEFLDEGRIHRISIIIPNEKQMEDVFYTLVRFLDYGERDEINFNILNKLIHGNYININEFLPEENEDIEEYDEPLLYEDTTPNELTEDEKAAAIKIANKKRKQKHINAK